MKRQIIFAAILGALVMQFPMAAAGLAIPGANGSDLTFAPLQSVEVNLGEAANAQWDAPSPAPGKGVYDAEKWAVVFKYTSVNVPPGAVVTFKNHPSGAPVVWLVSGTVNIQGTVNVSGRAGSDLTVYAEGGPGGQRGATIFDDQVSQPGFGLGGRTVFTAGQFADNAGRYAQIYGNARIIPLIGGSGGSSGSIFGLHRAGGGGGAILIAATGSISVSGSILAAGGIFSVFREDVNFHGSGGAIRLIAETITGSGILDAHGGPTGAGDGRVRIEAASGGNGLQINVSPSVALPDNPVLLWPGPTAPTAKIISVGGVAAPADPSAEGAFGVKPVDVTINTAAAVDVVIQTQNVQITGTVTVKVVPLRGTATTHTAVHTAGDAALSNWTASGVTLPQGGYVLQARALTN